ncbi:MAG: hypothetical protein ABSC48_17555 [Terracidiphilus sp.]|jgi:hypothetical protein
MVINKIATGRVSQDPEYIFHALQEIRTELERLADLCKEGQLVMTLKSVERMLKMASLQIQGARINFDGLERGANVTATTMEDELSTRAFFSLESAESAAWNNKRAGGEDVSDKFPSTDFEFEEYSKCFAIGRYTAAVFHLMRILEIGLACLAKSIGTDPADKSWEQILNGIQVALKANSQAKPPGWRDTEQFYSEVSAQFRNLKNAWRNYTMHVRITYDKERAEEIFVHVRSLMKTMSLRIQE